MVEFNTNYKGLNAITNSNNELIYLFDKEVDELFEQLKQKWVIDDEVDLEDEKPIKEV